MWVPGTNNWQKTFLRLAVAKNSLDGGTDYAFGGATTKDGTQDLFRYQPSAIGFGLPELDRISLWVV